MVLHNAIEGVTSVSLTIIIWTYDLATEYWLNGVINFQDNFLLIN